MAKMKSCGEVQILLGCSCFDVIPFFGPQSINPYSSASNPICKYSTCVSTKSV